MNRIGYHGTKVDITQFDIGYQGKGNDQYGSGFYFTTNAEVARGYALEPTKDLSTGKIMEQENDVPTLITVDIQMENPIIISGITDANLSNITFTSKQTEQIIRTLPSLYVEEDNILGDYFEEYWECNTKIEHLVDRFISEFYHDADFRQLDILFANYPDILHQAIRTYTGFDGIVVDFQDTTHLIPWFPEQIQILEKASLMDIEKTDEYLK